MAKKRHSPMPLLPGQLYQAQYEMLWQLAPKGDTLTRDLRPSLMWSYEGTHDGGGAWHLLSGTGTYAVCGVRIGGPLVRQSALGPLEHDTMCQICQDVAAMETLKRL